MSEPAVFLVIGLGNEFRCDDGCGPLAARLIDEKKFAGVKPIYPVADSTELILEWDGCDTAFLIDCVRSGAPPGTIYSFEPLFEEIPERLFRPTSSHRFDLTQIIQLAREIGKLPGRLFLFGIEGVNFENGTVMTSAVERAAGEVAGMIVAEIGARRSMNSRTGEIRR